MLDTFLQHVSCILDFVGDPRVAKNGEELPAAREVSLVITKLDTELKTAKKSDIDTVLVMQMGQSKLNFCELHLTDCIKNFQGNSLIMTLLMHQCSQLVIVAHLKVGRTECNVILL